MIIINKGFTLIELIVVIGIVAALAVLIGSNFYKLTGKTKDYENENVYKYLNEATCVFIGSKDYKESEDKVICGSSNCIKASTLQAKGYIDAQQGLLKNQALGGYLIKFKINSGEKICCVYSNIDTNNPVSGKGAC